MAGVLVVGYVRLIRQESIQQPRRPMLTGDVGVVNRVAVPSGSLYEAVGR
jgi:hypothetical protein